MSIRRRLAARVSLPLLLALAAAALALGCARGADIAPTAAPPQTLVPTAAPAPLAVAGAGVTPCSVSGPELPQDWQLANHVRWSPDGSRILFDVSVGEYGNPPVGLVHVSTPLVIGCGRL